MLTVVVSNYRSEEGEGFEGRDFHYSPGQYEGRYSQGGGGAGGYGEEGYQRGRPRERFVARGAFKQYDVRGGYHGRPPYKEQSSQDGFEKPKVLQSPAHSTSHSSSRHSSKRKRKKKHVSRSESRSRSRSSSSSSSSRSSSDSSGSRSSSGSSRSSSHKRKSQTGSGHIKSYRTESQDSIGSDHGGSKTELDKTRGVLVKNLPIRSSDTSLRDGLFHDFKKYGKINAVLVTGVAEDRYAVVSYRKTEDAEKAVHSTQGKVFFGMKIRTALTDGIEVDDNELRPPEAELDEHHPKATRTLFVGNLEKDISNEELRERFSKFGTILDIDVKRQGAISAYAFVQFTDISSVVKVLRELEGEVWGSMKLKLGFGKSMPTTCVWLDNVDQTVQENFLCRQFMRYGQVSHGIIDRIRGRALVFFVNLEMAQYALNEMRNRILNNRKIIIDFASRDCQTEFYEKMEKTGQLKPGMRPDERRGWMYNRQGPDGQWEATYDNRGSFYKFPYHQGGPPPFRGRGRGWGSRGGFVKEGFGGEEYRRTRSYEEYGRYPGGPPEGDFDQDLRAYQRERREHGSPSPSQYSDDPYGERYGKGYFKYPESYRSGGSPVSERAYEDFEYGKPRPDEKYFKERYPDMEFHDRHGYSPEGRSWSRSPTLGMPPKDSYGRNTPPTPMDDEMHDFSSHDNSPEGEPIGKYSEVKEKRRKSGDDFMINEADIAEINRASKYHAGYRKGQESPWREDRYDRKRSYDESFSNEFGQFEQSPHKLDRQISRGSKSSIADSRRDICQKVRKIESKITEKLKKGKTESSPSSGSSESGELTEGELTKLQSEKQLLLDKLKSLDKDSSNSDLEEGMIEEDRRKTPKRPRLESDSPWEKSSKNELTNAKGHPKKSVSYDSTISLRKQMDHLRKMDETKKMEEKNRNYASNASRTSLDAEGSEAEEFTAMLSPKEISASFKRRKKHETAEEKRSYRLKRGDEEMSSDNEENKNLSRTDSLSSNPVFRRMSSGHSSPRTPGAPHGHDLSSDVLRHSESDLSANEGHSSFTEDSLKKKSESASKIHGHRSKHRHKEDHQPTVIPLGEDEPNSELSDPRSRNVISEQISLPLPRFAELDLNVMMSPDAENSEERMKSESPCFSPPSSGSKNTNSPQRSPSESVSADSQEPLQPEYIPEEGTNEVPSEEQLLGKTKEKSDFDSDDGFSDTSDHMDNFESDDKLSLEERIRRLDEKLRAVPTPSTSTKPVSDISASLSINSGSKGEACNSSLARTALYSKFRISKRQDASGNGIDNKTEGSDITHTIVSRKISIFDQDAKRLEQISEKYSPKTNLSSVEDTHVSMPVMTKAAVKEMPLATLPGSLTGRLGNSAAFPTLSVNTTTANQTGLKPEEMFSSPTSEISTPSPAFNSSQEKPIWQTENFTGSPRLVEPAITAYSLVPKTNFSEQTNNSGNSHPNSSKEDLISKPFVTPAVKKQLGLSNLTDSNSVFTNSVFHDEKLHSPKETEKLSQKCDTKSSPNRNEQTVSPKLSPKPLAKMDSNVNSFVETNSSIKSDLMSDLHPSDSNKLTNSSDKINSLSVQSVNEPMEEDTPSVLCDMKSNSALRTKNVDSDITLSNHVTDSHVKKTVENKENSVTPKLSESSDSLGDNKVIKQDLPSSSVTKDNSISKLNGSKEHTKKVNETVEDVLGLNSPVVLGKRKAEVEEKPKSNSSNKDKSSVKEISPTVNMTSESELSEKDDKTPEPDVKKVKLTKSESSSSEGEKADSKNKVKSKDSQKKDKESKKKEACEDDMVKKEKNNGEKKDKDRDGNSSKGSAGKSSSSGEKAGSSGKSSSKSHDKSQASSKSSSVKAEDKVPKPNTDKIKSSKSEEKNKTEGKSESKSKSDDKTKSEKTNDGNAKKLSDKKSEHKKEHKSSSAKTSDVTKVKDKDKSAKEGQKGKAKDEQSGVSKPVKSEKTGHGNSDKSTKDGVNKNKKESGEKSKGEGCKPKEEQKERSQSFDSPSKSKDPPQQDTKERSQSMTESEKVKDKSNPSSGDVSKENKSTEGKSSSEKDKGTKHVSPTVKSAEKSRSKEHSKAKVKDRQSSSDKGTKEDSKDKSGVKAEETSERKSEVKTEQKSEHSETKSEQKSDSSETKSGNGDKGGDKSDKNGDKGGDKSGDKSGNSDGKQEMKGFGSDDRKHEKKKSSHSDSSKSIKKSDKVSGEKSQKSSSHKISKTDLEKDKSQKSDREKSKGHSVFSEKEKGHSSFSEKEKKSKSSEKAKKAEKENKEVKSLSTIKKKPETVVDTVKSPEYKKPVEDDFDWDAWQEPYVSMYDKVKRRSTIKDQERERERELEKTRERLDKLQEKRQNKKASKQKAGKPNFRSDYTESEFTDEDDVTGTKNKKKNSTSNNKKKAPQIYSSSSESDYDFEEPLFPSQKKAQAKPKVQSIPKKKKKASILDIYSSDSEESSDSSFGIPRSVNKKKPKTPKRDQSLESDDLFGLKQKPVDVKKKSKKDTPHKSTIKSPARKNFNEIFSSSDSDSDTDPAIQESPKPVQRSKSVKEKVDKPGNKIYSSSESDSMDEMFTPQKKMVLTESLKDKVSKSIKTPKKHDNSNKKKTNNIYDDSRTFKGLVTTQTVSETDLPITCKGENMFGPVDNFTDSSKKEKSAKNIRKKEKEDILVGEGKLEIGKKQNQGIGLFDKMENFHSITKDEKDINISEELKSPEKKSKDSSEKSKKKKESKKRKEPTFDKKTDKPSSTSVNSNNVSNFEKGIVFGDSEKIENDVIVEEVPIDDSFLVEAPVHDENARNMWDSSDEILPRSNCVDKAEANRTKLDSQGESLSVSDNSEKLGTPSTKNKKTKEGESSKKSKKKDKADKESKPKKKKKKQRLSSDMDKTIDDVSKGKDLLHSTEPEAEIRTKADGASSDHSDVDLDFSTPLFGNFVPAVIKPARPSLKEKEKAVPEKTDKEVEKNPMSVNKENELQVSKVLDKNMMDKSVTEAVVLDGEKEGESIPSHTLDDVLSPKMKHTTEKILERKIDLNTKAFLHEKTDIGQDKIKSSIDIGMESSMKVADKPGLKSDGLLEKKVITPPKDALTVLSTSSKEDLPPMPGLLSPLLPKNGSLIPTTQPSAILKSQTPQPNKHNKPGSKSGTDDTKKNMHKKPNSAFKKTKGTDVFEFKEDDSDLIEPLNFKHRHSDVEKTKNCSENKNSTGQNEVSDKPSSIDNTSKPKPVVWDIPSMDNFTRRDSECKPKTGVHHEQESLFANWAKSLTEVKSAATSVEPAFDHFKGCSKKQPRKMKIPQKQPAKTTLKSDSVTAQLTKDSEEKEGNGSREDLARDNFGFDLLTKDVEDSAKKEVKDKTPAPKDRQEETLEAVSSLQSLADNDKDQLSEDDALVIDESVNTAAPDQGSVTSPENVPPQADSETALAIQSILSFDDQEKPPEQETPTAVETEPVVTPVDDQAVTTQTSDNAQSVDAVPVVQQPQVIQRPQEVPSVPDVPNKTAEQTLVDNRVCEFEMRPETVTPVRQEQNSFPEVPITDPIITPTKTKKQRVNKRRKTSKSPVQGPYHSFQENTGDQYDLHNREDSDDGALHIATESPNPEPTEHQESSVVGDANNVDVALSEKDVQQKPLLPLHISLNGASISEKPERQSRSRRKKNAKSAEMPQSATETINQHQPSEIDVLSEFGSPHISSEKVDLSISDSERTDDGDASFGDEGIDGKRPRRGARKPKNYKELSGITPRTNSPRSRTSPRSPRGASPKADIASPVVKIERLPNVAKNQQREDEEQGGKDLISREILPVKEAPRRGRSSAAAETGDIQHKSTNVFDFDANEAEEKSESCAAPVPKRRSSSRRKKGSSEGLDGTVLTSEIKETGIKISIARQPAGLQKNNSQDHNKDKTADAKKAASQTCEAKPAKDIQNALPPLLTEPEKKAIKPRDMMNAEARSRSNSVVREEPISITIPKSKIMSSLPAPITAMVTTPSTTQTTTMSNIDRIIDNVSKGIFDWNDVDDNAAQLNKLTTPLTIDVGVIDKKRAATRNHGDEIQHLKSPQLVSPVGQGALKSPCTTLSVVSPMTAGQQMAGLKSPHRDLLKPGPNLQSPLLSGNMENTAHKAMMEEGNKIMAPPTVGSSPIQTQASPIVTLANKFDSHFNHVMGGARFPPPMSAHAANTTVVMTTSNSPLVSTGMSSAAQQEMVLNMSKHAPSSVAMTTASPVSEAATVLSTAGNTRSVISSSHSHVPQPANDKFQQPDPVTTSGSTVIGEKRSNSLDRIQQSVTSAPTCVVHPITTTSLTSKQQQDAQAAQMMQLRMAEPRLSQMQALIHGDSKALEGLSKEQICALMEHRGVPPFLHPMTEQHIIQQMANQKALFEMQKHQESVVKHPKGRNQKNTDPVKESQRPPSAHSNPKQGVSPSDRLPVDQFNFPPMAFQDQIRAHYGKLYGPQVWAHLQHLQNLKQLEEKNKMHAAVDPKTSSPSILHQPSSVIAATVASQHGQHPQIKSPALAQTAPSPHQVGPTFTQAHSLQRPPSPQTGKKGSDKIPHNNRWPEANIIPAHEGQRSRPPSHDAERASPRDHWAYGQAPKPAHQHQDSVPMSQKERLMQRQKEEQHQREMQIQQEMQREKEKKQQQELQWQLEDRARQEATPAHSQGRRESNANSLPNQPTDLRQTALVPGQQRIPGQADKEMVDPRFGQHPGIGFPADLRRPSSQNPGGFPQPVSAAELSPGVSAHLTPEMQRRYQERVLAMGHHMQIDPLHMQQLLAQGLRPHFLPGGGIQVEHPALSEGRPPSQSSHRGENSQGHGQASKLPSDGPMMHIHEASMHGIPPRPLHDGPPGGEGSLLSSLQRYPVMWQGVLALKNDQCVVQLHLINGFNQLVKMSLPQTSPDGTVQPLRIAQRMRLEAAQLEGVVKRMQFDKDYCMLLALPCGRNHEDIISQTRAMATGFIQYLQQKQAAGIVNVPEPESLQPAYVVHIFPPCEFSHNTLGRLGFDLLHQVRDLAHLLVIITTVA